MAHKAQVAFFEELQKRFCERFSKAVKILEVGSQNINGTVRDFFASDIDYLGIDLGMTKCVDWVIPGELIELPDNWADIVISTECFEHCQDWDKVLINMIRILKPGGLCIITCASGERPTHGTIDSEEASSPFTSSYYKNLGPDNIANRIRLGAYFERHSFEINSIDNDLYFWGVCSSSLIKEIDDYWEDPVSRLARCQGQLGQAASRHAKINHELIQAKADADQAKAKAEQIQDRLTKIENSTSWALTMPARKIMDLLRRIFG